MSPIKGQEMNLEKSESSIYKLWKDVHPLWIRYCGVSDEMKTLRNRWLFLADLQYSPLPDVKDTLFNRLIALDSTFQTMFGRLGFSRYVLETRGKFIHATEAWERDELEIFLSGLREMFAELEEYLGKLKLTFFQRTSSLEIPFQAGLARSPQKTMGDEIVHLAADNVAACYLNCLRWHSDLAWDRVVSFVYPVQEAFTGGIFHVMPHTKLFHLSLSEDGKYFPGAFLFLAHEVSHATMYKVVGGMTRHCHWVIATWGRFYRYIHSFEDLKKDIISRRVCENCDNRNYIESLFSFDRSGYYLRQCIADIVGLEIGGICSLLAIVDFAPFLETLFRVAFLAGYYHEKKGKIEEILSEKEYLYSVLLRKRGKTCGAGNPQLCLDFLVELGTKAGMSFSHDDATVIPDYLPSLFKSQSEQLPSESDRRHFCQNFFDLACDENYCTSTAPNIISHLVKKPFNYSFDSNMADQLTEGLCAPAETDPRLMLHVFYKLYRMRGPPSYSATLHNLAFFNPLGQHHEEL
jgi:hypothetical protein